jgi:hypothetical protein
MPSIGPLWSQPESNGLFREEVLESMAQAPAPSTAVETTLYDLVSVLCDELEDEEEELVLPILIHLLNSGRVKFIDGRRKYKVTCS